jgi:hypothetical protein
MPSDLERRLERALAPVDEPGAEVEARLRAAALAALPPPRAARRRRFGPRRWRRRIGPLALVGALLIAGAALAANLIDWDAGSTGRTGAFVSRDAARRFAATGALAGAPWLSGGATQTIREVPPRPSLVFPPGTGYRQALQQFYDAASREGRLPAGTRLGEPLPVGKVVSLPAGPGDPLRLDLRAPFGYLVPSGTVLGPRYALGTATVTFPPTGGAGTPLPTGVTVVAPRLLPCQTMHGDRPDGGCPTSALPPGAAYGPGAVSVPALAGRRLPQALAAAQAARLGLFARVGYLPAVSEGALAGSRTGGPADVTAESSLVPLSEFVRSGYGAPGLYRPGGRAGVRLSDAERRPPGTVIAQFPPAGTLVPPGTPLVLAAAADDCLLANVEAGPWDCVPGSAEARQAEPALAGALPWLSRRDGALHRLSEVTPRPSLTFPSGTSHLEALRALLVAVVERGRLPQGAVVGPPLRRGVVLIRPARGRGPVLDLRAPFGYDPATGQIAPPTTAALSGSSSQELRASVRSGRAALLPAAFAGDHLLLPGLPSCQVVKPGELRRRCRAAR